MAKGSRLSNFEKFRRSVVKKRRGIITARPNSAYARIGERNHQFLTRGGKVSPRLLDEKDEIGSYEDRSTPSPLDDSGEELDPLVAGGIKDNWGEAETEDMPRAAFPKPERVHPEQMVHIPKQTHISPEVQKISPRPRPPYDIFEPVAVPVHSPLNSIPTTKSPIPKHVIVAVARVPVAHLKDFIASVKRHVHNNLFMNDKCSFQLHTREFDLHKQKLADVLACCENRRAASLLVRILQDETVLGHKLNVQIFQMKE